MSNTPYAVASLQSALPENQPIAGSDSAPQIPGTGLAPAPPQQPAPPAAPDLSAPPMNVDDFSKLFLAHLLQRTPPPPASAQGPAGSFASKLASAVTGIQTGLGDAAHANDVKGGGWLTGVTSTLAARNSRVENERRQSVEEQQRQQQLDREDATAKQGMAESNARMLHEQRLTHQIDEAAINSSVADGQKAVAALTSDPTKPQHGEVVAEGLTSDELHSQLQQKKFDPTTVTAYPTGRKQVGEDADGQPIMRTTYSLVQPPKDITLDETSRALLSPEDQKKMPVGTVLSGVTYNQLYQNNQDEKAATAARDKTLADNEIAADQTSQKLEAVKLGLDWNNALSQHNNNPVEALQTMNSNPAMRQKYPHLAEDVAQAYGGAKEFETIRHNYEDEREKRVKDYNEAHPAGGALGNIPQSEGMQKQIADLTAANPSAAAVLKKFDNLTQASLMAVAYGDGSVDFDKVFPTRLTKGAPGITSQNAIAVLKQINPNFSEQQYRATQAAYKEATTGKNAQAIQQYNNFMQHSAEAVDVLAATGRMGPKAYNAALNKMETLGYGTTANQIESALIPVRGELALLSAGGYKPSEPEQKAIDTVLSASATPAQISASLQQLAETGTIRLDNINQNYQRVTGKNLPRIIDQKTLDAAKHLGISAKGYGTLQGLDSSGTIFGSQTPTGANAPAQAQPSPQQPHAVVVNGKIVGYTTDGKTMTPVAPGQGQ